jgi:tripartite-type tricarboxylate transporter receptor subunit TctC
MDPGLTRRALLAAAAAWPASAPWASGRLQGFPRQAVRLVVPYSVGIGPDVVARSVAEQLSQQWQQPVWVDNKPGASGIVAFAELRRTAPDGHTLFLADTGSLVVNPLLHVQLPYDPLRDMDPLTMLFRATFVLWVGAANRLRSLAALQDAARQAPGRVSYASLGHGHPSQVAVESFAHAAGLQLLHVPFKDGAALMSALVAGDVDFTAFSVNTMAALYSSARVRPLAVAAHERLAGHPTIPTLQEAGGPAVEMHPWAALMAVAGTPHPVLQTLQQDIAQALASASVSQRVAMAGFELIPSTPQAVHDRMRADTAMVSPLIQAGRISRQ